MVPFIPGQMVIVNGKYKGEFIRETGYRVEIRMMNVPHIFIKKSVVAA